KAKKGKQATRRSPRVPPVRATPAVPAPPTVPPQRAVPRRVSAETQTPVTTVTVSAAALAAAAATGPSTPAVTGSRGERPDDQVEVLWPASADIPERDRMRQVIYRHQIPEALKAGYVLPQAEPVGGPRREQRLMGAVRPLEKVVPLAGQVVSELAKAAPSESAPARTRTATSSAAAVKAVQSTPAIRAPAKKATTAKAAAKRVSVSSASTTPSKKGRARGSSESSYSSDSSASGESTAAASPTGMSSTPLVGGCSGPRAGTGRGQQPEAAAQEIAEMAAPVGSGVRASLSVFAAPEPSEERVGTPLLRLGASDAEAPAVAGMTPVASEWAMGMAGQVARRAMAGALGPAVTPVRSTTSTTSMAGAAPSPTFAGGQLAGLTPSMLDSTSGQSAGGFGEETSVRSSNRRR
ncbi:MAG: proteophosphoglycan ppg1, partial [Rhodospirillaceae bacterium]